MADAIIWKRRVAGWRASGQSADAYAVRHGFSSSTLKWWAWKLGRDPSPKPVVRLAQLIRGPSTDSVVRRGSILVDLIDARARIALDGDVDRALFADVVSILTTGSKR